MNQTPRTLGTLDKTFAIIDQLKNENGARVTTLATTLDISKGTVHKHLTTLVHHGYVVKEGDEYNLGLRFANLGEFAKTRKTSYKHAREMAQELSAETDLDSGFLVEENGRGVYLKTEAEETDNPHFEPKIGHREPLHTSAAGKAILAALPPSRVDQIIDRWGLTKATDATITDRETLFDELAEIRARGYAFNRGENKEGVRAVAVAVNDADGTVLGGVSLTIPEYRADDEWFKQEIPNRLLEAAERFEKAH